MLTRGYEAAQVFAQPSNICGAKHTSRFNKKITWGFRGLHLVNCQLWVESESRFWDTFSRWTWWILNLPFQFRSERFKLITSRKLSEILERLKRLISIFHYVLRQCRFGIINDLPRNQTAERLPKFEPNFFVRNIIDELFTRKSIGFWGVSGSWKVEDWANGLKQAWYFGLGRKLQVVVMEGTHQLRELVE
jgi:hypothetical protein